MQTTIMELKVTETPVRLAETVSRAVGCEIYVKHDGLTHAHYGGNKVRKLRHILAAAEQAGATDLLTLGAVGSHHVLATGIHGRTHGFRVHAVVTPQPRTAHVEAVSLAHRVQGIALYPVAKAALVPWRLWRVWSKLKAQGRRPYFVMVGGSSPSGALGYLDAVQELARQVSVGAAPKRFHGMACALGSGGTLAGLHAGLQTVDLTERLVGVRVTDRWMVSTPMLQWLRRGALRLIQAAPRYEPELELAEEQLGDGYGHETLEGRRAQDLFAQDGVVLDPTYTAKAAAGLLARAQRGKKGPWLFWATLSAVDMKPLCEATRETEENSPELQALML